MTREDAYSGGDGGLLFSGSLDDFHSLRNATKLLSAVLAATLEVSKPYISLHLASDVDLSADMSPALMYMRDRADARHHGLRKILGKKNIFEPDSTEPKDLAAFVDYAYFSIASEITVRNWARGEIFDCTDSGASISFDVPGRVLEIAESSLDTADYPRVRR